MNHKLLLVASIAIFVSGTFAQSEPMSSSVQEGEHVQFESTFKNSDPVPLNTGETGRVNFKVSNIGSTTAEDVELEIVDRYPFEVVEDRRSEYEFGDMVPNEEYHVNTEVRVAEDADDGSHNLRAKISHGGVTRDLNIPVEVSDDQVTLSLANLGTEPSVIRPDTEDNTLNLEVVNTGDKTGENVVVDLDYPSGFEETSSFSSRQQLGDIQSGELREGNFNFDLNKSAETGMNTVNTTITYGDPDDGVRTTQEETFEINIDGKPIFEVEKVSSNLEEDSKGQITLRVENVGSEDSKSTRARVIEASDRPLDFDSTNRFIGTLESNSSTEATFETTPEQNGVGEHLIDFQIRGTKGDEVFVEEQTISVEVEQTMGTSAVYLLIPAAALIVLLVYFRKKIITNIRNLK